MRFKAWVLGMAVALAVPGAWVGADMAAYAEPLKAGKSGAQFAHIHSDLPVDPTARFGRLANGMTYVIYPNTTQPGKVVMRLRVGAGVLDEADEESGIANLITYMAFSGSAHYPQGDMFRQLERQGIQMGAGQQARVSEGETNYQITLPRNDEATLETGFNVMQDMAFGLTFPEAALQRDRDLVVTQMVNQARPLERHFENWLRTAFAGQLLAERPQKGQRDIVLYTPRDSIVNFYNSFYRPDLTTLVIVGDVDVEALEKRVQKSFGGWKAKTADYPRRDPGVYAARGPRAYTYFEPGLPEIIDISWLRPVDTRYQNRDLVRDMMLENLVLGALNARLERAAARADSPITRASINTGRFQRTGDSAGFYVMPRPGQTQDALALAIGLIRQAGEFGFTDAEYRRTVADYEASLQQRKAGEATRSNEWIADMIAGSVDARYVINSPSQDVEFYESLKPQLTREAMNAYLKNLLKRDGPLISLIGPAPVAGLDAPALERQYAGLSKAKLSPPEDAAAKAWLYNDFGPAQAPVKTVRDEALDYTRLTYANGVTVNIKTTRLKANEVVVTVRSAGGLKRLSPKKPTPVFALNFYDLFEGGLVRMSAAEINEATAGENFELSYHMTEDAAVLLGQSGTKDFTRQMQVLRAFYSDAGFDPSYLERVRHTVPSFYTYANTSPGGVLGLHLSRILYDNDSRVTPLSQAEFTTLSNDSLAAVVRTSLHDAPVEITVVGDITVDQARPALDATFGTLPPLPATYATIDGSDEVHFPKSGLFKTLYHQGGTEQALVLIAFPTTDRYSDPATAVGLDLLAEVISLRHYEAGRADTGSTYVPLARNVNSTTFKGFGYLSATVQVYPGAETGFYNGFLGLVEGVKAQPVSADELLRARQLLLTRLTEETRTNGYWLNLLPGAAENPGQRDYALKRKALIEAVTPAQLQDLAKRYLDADKALKVLVLPVPKGESRAS
ncbi:insulinase family protein [Asticcacaulis sp. BYS171W]|uniref:Insulinase family protein n=1 Tax=Asticcacaulis aquaticus TaxID=2984212 RepID=A0ABT5HTN7_9CAUL|nr:M16 family metallopeptidase [Asticcacaulis aquaticus]MDC7683404.1 insulinase family protein [Asticcacaulis aquaticus]